MSIEKRDGSVSRRTEAKTGLIRLLDNKTLSPEFVSAVAGDRPFTEQESLLYESMKARRGGRFYSDLLFSITHQYVPVEQAEELWEKILKNKYEMSEAMGRNVRVTVAALDYLSNITEMLDAPMLISGSKMATVAEVALQDGMTGLYDHTAFMTKLDQEFHRYERYGNRIAVIMLDIDHFKIFNDTYGHPEGDKVLSALGEIIRSQVRDVDVAARYGGEEFAIMLPRTASEEALMTAERIRVNIEKHFQLNTGVTASLGVATCPQNATTGAALVQAADIALYTSKNNGRNQSTLCSSD